MSNFRQVDRETGCLLPPSVDEWLPERYRARFVVEVIDRLDLSALVGADRGAGSASDHPSVLLGLLVYGDATGVVSSRQLERATHDSVAFRFIAANDHPEPAKVKNLQKLLVRSSCAKLLAIKATQINRGKRVPGIDGVVLPRAAETPRDVQETPEPQGLPPQAGPSGVHPEGRWPKDR